MLGMRYIKVPPTTYLMQFKNGRVVREGLGLSFFYYAPTTSLVAVPVGSADVPFIFQETTGDFQSVTIQGQVTYRVGDARRLASRDGRQRHRCVSRYPSNGASHPRLRRWRNRERLVDRGAHRPPRRRLHGQQVGFARPDQGMRARPRRLEHSC